jgi:D-threo-aldose 1-dehydrogenase
MISNGLIMRMRNLPNTDLSLSVFSFGTASLHHLTSQSDRQRLLFRAADGGFSHFDTAPLYGFGLAERSLASLLASRKELTVATKVGLYPPGGSSQTAGTILARKIVGKIFPSVSRAQVDWSVSRANRSLEGSLKRLGRERADILFLHEPDSLLVATDEWLGWLETISSRYRYIGVAGSADRVSPFLRKGAPFNDVIQISDSLSRREADILLVSGRPLQITYGYVSADPKTSAEHTLAEAIKRNNTGSVLISTRRSSRIDQYSRLGA